MPAITKTLFKYAYQSATFELSFDVIDQKVAALEYGGEGGIRTPGTR